MWRKRPHQCATKGSADRARHSCAPQRHTPVIALLIVAVELVAAPRVGVDDAAAVRAALLLRLLMPEVLAADLQTNECLNKRVATFVLDLYGVSYPVERHVEILVPQTGTNVH